MKVKSRWLKGISFLCACIVVFGMAACGKKDKPPFKTTLYKGELVSFEIPEDWEAIADPSGQGLLVFAPKEGRGDTGFNNVTVYTQPAEAKSIRPEDVKTAFSENFETQIKGKFADASGFAYADLEAGDYQVFTASYKCTLMGREIAQTLYIPIVGQIQVCFAACDGGVAEEGVPSASEVAQYMVKTMAPAGQEDAKKD